ncbi:MAG: ABC transporter ATP-binding protein/permease [Prevotellaceae bacterium]|jgi:ABC-type multidrug transport system fused ATPase/permease subunit|nr:ABC transporter ATP-binding protein/permease [Prevotellaceae bacterium]
MKTLIILLKRFAAPYRRYIVWNFVSNILSTIFSLFSFATIIPVLQILFGLETARHTFIAWGVADGFNDMVKILANNAFCLIEYLIDTYGGAVALMWLGVFLILMTFLKTGMAYLATLSLIPVRTGVQRDLRNTIYRKIVDLPIGYFNEERKGDIMSRMTADVSEIENSIMSSLEIVFKNPLMIVIYMGTLFFLSWQLTFFVMILLPLSGYLIGNIGRNLKKRSLYGQELSGELLSQVEETIGGLRVVKAFNAERKLINRFAALNEKIRRTFNRINRRYLLAHPLGEFFGTVVIAILLWYGGLLILDENGTLSAAEFIYYLTIFYMIVAPFKELSKASYSIRKGAASLQRVDEVLQTKHTLKQERSVHITGFEKEICLKEVWFKYQEAWTLRNINLTVKKGQTIALVGQSGSGKSTLVDLIPRFYDVVKGGISIDGKDVRMLNLHDLRELMGNVNQEAILFNDTFFNNIAFGVETATMDEVIAAAKIANIHDFIMQTEEGYQTNIGDRGGRLSGGQRQRVSIARAILKNPAILILDEATSALDTESERLVQDAVEQLMKNRTSIVIAHRLSTIRQADMICVLHEGEIVERGSHDELICLNGYYKRLCDMQNF